MLVVFDDSIQEIKLEINDHVELTTTSSNGENILTTNFTFEQFEAVIDEYRRKIGENTISELEDNILQLEMKVSNLEEHIDCMEYEADLKREQYLENEVF